MRPSHYLLQYLPPLKRFVGWVGEGRAQAIAERIHQDLPAGTHTLCDIGCGTGHVTRALRQRGYDVTGVDLVDWKFFPDVKPVLYDGQTMPFRDDQFDVALVITVLHHCPDHTQILREALRVAPRVLVIEDVVRGRLHTLVTKIVDSLANLEIFGHPHSNKTDDEWLATFADLGATASKTSAKWGFLVMWQVAYLVERQQDSAMNLKVGR